MRSLIIALFSFLTLIAVTPILAADLRGQVLQGSGAPAANLEVSLTGPQAGKATTNGSGFYEFKGIPPGTYTLTIKGHSEEVRVPPQGTERKVRLP